MPIPPDVVLAILRDPECTAFPCQITVFCDECGEESTGDYLVDEKMTKGQRLRVARTYLADKEGWRCEAGEDLCPSCLRRALEGKGN